MTTTTLRRRKPPKHRRRSLLGSGWDAFVAVAFAVVYVAAVLAPFLVIALLVAGIAWFVVRRRAPPTATPHPAEETLSEQPDRGPATPVG